ncbi:DUF6185 family protein [Streptomyces inhibens]|uniref:DUF6185 family protein n=1 Tax=Streptomyces inhibens TaxID=2293571 RepID=UPI0037B04C77
MSAPEMISVAWRWILLVFVTLGWWAAQPTQTHAADTADCPATQLTKANVNSSITFSQRYRDFVEVHQETTIKVPERQWPLAGDLTLSENTPKYRNAMYCLLRGNAKAQTRFEEWHPEWPSSSSWATKVKGLVTVQYESWNLIDGPGEFEVGPWEVKATPDEWRAALHSQGALSGASREKIKVDPGGLKISDAPGAASENKDSSRVRVWNGNGPDIEVKLVSPRRSALGSSRGVSWISYLGVVSWWVCASVVIAVSAWKFLARMRAADDPERAASRVLAFTAFQWAGLSVFLGLTLLLLLHPSPGVNRWRALIGILSGLALVLLARPWLPSAQDSDDSQRIPKRRVMVFVASAVAGAGLLVILAPHLFGLPSNLMPKASTPASGIAWLALLDVFMLFLWLAAVVAWAWRFAREGKLGESSGGTKSEYPESSSGSERDHPLRPVAAIGVALAVAAVMVVFCRALSFELFWKRANRMGEATALFGADHGSALGRQLADFASRGPQWAYAYTWVLTGIALLALLHISSGNEREKPLGPKGVDLLLVAAVFAIVVALRGTAFFAGRVAEVYALWVPLNMVALYAMVKAGRRWSVLSRVDRQAETHCVVAELSDPEKHERLLDDAHRCRDLLRRLHLVDHGHAKEATRRSLEKQLHLLHHWRPTRCRHDCLPDTVSVVDVALSWGPRQHWWDNGLNAARWASIFGILPSMVTAWYENAYGAKHWTFTISLPTGIPDTVGSFLAREISFAGAGLVLGALWRVLPGERGPVRAFNLFIAWLVPIGAIALLNTGIDRRELGLAVLNIVLMLMVLTLTSMWMDTDTFRRERHYKTRRLGLLTSVYQAHGLSGQVAFLIAQLATAVTIWRQIVTVWK